MSLFWFRRDLRIIDNPALYHAVNNGCRTAIFISTPKQWRVHDVAAIQIDFIERHLNLLTEQLSSFGIELIHLEATDFIDQIKVLSKFCQQKSITDIYANSELELNECRRDNAIIEQGLSLKLFEADVIVEKGKVLNAQQEMYKVFTPFRNAWLKQLKHTDLMPVVLDKNQGVILNKVVPKNIVINAAKENSDKWPLVSDIHQTVLNDFFNDKHDEYHLYRDIPSIKGTSGLSPYFAIGALSAKFIVYLLIQRFPELFDDAKNSNFTWLNELAWRDFYKHLMYHVPRLCKHQDFQEKYIGTQWPKRDVFFKAWCEGKTGYPLVDAAMRQLKQTGWMHNRLRMVVASFLTKHLLVDWRRGEKFFMQHLIDGDLSANNGGWQWAASTGCDAQPYFRVFNPIRQSERFDPDGSFIRKYLPELKDVPNKHIHFPHHYIAEQNKQSSKPMQSTLLTEKALNYWPAVVDHKTARLAALEFYKR